MTNERKTEIITRKFLTNNNYYQPSIRVEEQQSEIPNISKCLKNASKKGNGPGYPEFIISSNKYPNTIIVIECKAELHKHQSPNLDKYDDFAIDGVLLYASYLKNEYDVIAIAISGTEEKNCKIDIFKWIKNDIQYHTLHDTKIKADIKEILSFDKFIEIIDYSPQKQKIEYQKVIDYSKNLHDFIYGESIAIGERDKPLLVSAIILGLEDKVFFKTFDDYETETQKGVKTYNLSEELLKAVETSLKNTGMSKDKIDKMKQVMAFIGGNDILMKTNIKTGYSYLYEIIKGIKSNVYPFIKKYTEFDIIGKFYSEFIRYTGGDGSSLGIVLTPKHVTELMCDLIRINEDSTVLDTCTGTAGFLISAMSKMIDSANKNIKNKEVRDNKIKNIKEYQLMGVEQQADIFTMGCANMYFRGDGKTNLLLGSCFELKDKLVSEKKENGILISTKPTHALINPPYAQKNGTLKEIDFIQFTLDCLIPGGKLACIVPMSTAINTKAKMLEKRKKLLNNHRLDAVFSMPNDLFYPVGTNTCIMVFTAHEPHDKDKYHNTFFSYLKNDGFSITRKGRMDQGAWESIKDNYLNLFFNKKEEIGKSILKKVSAKDEWCVEAYMDTVYDNINDEDFIINMKKYIAFKLINGDLNLLNIKNKELQNYELNISKWEKYQIKELFDVYTGGDKPKFDDLDNINQIYSIENLTSNNGVNGKISYNGKNIYSNYMTMVSIGEGGTTFYQEDKSAIFTRVKGLVPKKTTVMNKYIAMFLTTLLNQERFKYSYGRVVSADKLKNTFISLPTKNKQPDWDFMEGYIKSLKYSELI